MKIFTVDAFAENMFGGNQAGVIVLPKGQDYPDEEKMKRLAGELKYSETAYVKILEPGCFQIRYFTPAAEVELCGHATIASFECLKHIGVCEDNNKYTLHTVASDLEIELKNGKVLMDMATPVKLNEINEEDDLQELYEIMGLHYEDYKKTNLKLIPQIISTGLPDIMLPVGSMEQLNAIRPDFPKLAELSKKYNVVGVHAFTLEKFHDDETCHVRNFAPLYDIDEESATGTSNGALTYYGYLNGFVTPDSDCKFIQGENMNRPSVICSHIENINNEIKIKVGGSAVIIIDGEIEF